MALTRIDCQFYRGTAASSSTSSFVALNPTIKPGSMVIASSSAARESISSQVACKLSLEHFVSGILDYFDATKNFRGESEFPETSLQALEAAFKNANSSVYNFGHKLAAGGRMAATLLGLVIEEDSIAAGRVGQGAAYLYRNGELFPFFEPSDDPVKSPISEAFVGSQSLVTVELASVPIAESDIVLVFSEYLSAEKERNLQTTLQALDRINPGQCSQLCQALYEDPSTVSFSMLATVGPDAIYLSEIIEIEAEEDSPVYTNGQTHGEFLQNGKSAHPGSTYRLDH